MKCLISFEHFTFGGIYIKSLPYLSSSRFFYYVIFYISDCDLYMYVFVYLLVYWVLNSGSHAC
jgi:hypothetical protein